MKVNPQGVGTQYAPLSCLSLAPNPIVKALSFAQPLLPFPPAWKEVEA